VEFVNRRQKSSKFNVETMRFGPTEMKTTLSVAVSYYSPGDNLDKCAFEFSLSTQFYYNLVVGRPNSTINHNT